MKHLKSVFPIFFAFAAACGGTGSNGPNPAVGGAGGQGSTTSQGGNGNGNSGAGSPAVGGAGNQGGGEVCHPWGADACADAQSCECVPYMNDALPKDAVCPFQQGDTCSPGHNQCGCDLPLGQDYAEPGDCYNYVNSDTWNDEDSNPGGLYDNPNDNGQSSINDSFGGPDAYYYSGGWTMSGNKLYWNRANKDVLESSVGEFTKVDGTPVSSCEADWEGVLTVKIYDAGKTEPRRTRQFYWVSH